MERRLRDKLIAFQWGYGHYMIFGAAAAIGALVNVNVDILTNYGSIELGVANFGFAVAVALYLFGLWFCQERLIAKDKLQSFVMPGAALATIMPGLLPQAVLTIGFLISATVIYRHFNPLIHRNM